MKIFFLLIFLISSLFGAEKVTILDYEPKHLSTIIGIINQNPVSFFNYEGKRDVQTLLHVFESNFQKFFNALDDKNRTKKVMMAGETVIGFACAYKTKELTTETLIKSNLVSYENGLKLFPLQLYSDAASPIITIIEYLAIDTTMQRRGYGSQLLQHILTYTDEQQPSSAYVHLYTGVSNIAMQKTCNAVGFTLSPLQYFLNKNAGLVSYEKMPQKRSYYE